MRPSRVAGIGAILSISLVSLITAGLENVQAQDRSQVNTKDEPKLGISNTTDLSLVVTDGNSDSTTIGFSEQLRYVWKRARFDFSATAVRSDKSDDRFFLVEPGLEFPVGGELSNPATSLVKPKPTLDVANYMIRGTYERDISSKLFWNTGASWYRNHDAGILNRYIAFAGLGNKWVNRERRRFTTSYGLSYIDREEEEPDPERDRRFPGARFGWDYTERFNAGTTFDSDFALNANLSDGTDYEMNTVNALTVSVNNHVAIKVSLQWFFENQPALETDLDVIAYVELVNPDGRPGSGDERFRTLGSGSTKLVLGSSSARKDKLDTIVRTSLVIKF